MCFAGGRRRLARPARTDPDDHTPAVGELTATPVGTAVDNVRNNGPQLLEPIPEPA
ncbi:hypothetical protein [Kitasatospora sp. NBC_00374]|uniref:hypothetical protein n=1 Tax=Kitasatospora sp. NBC_00374 TaxID=2975964 RepID=UPI00352D6314